MIFAIIFLPLGAFYIYVAFGLYHGKGWGWKYTIIVQTISIVASVSLLTISGAMSGGPDPAHSAGEEFGGAIPSIIIFIITMSYMLKPKTRAYFGKVQVDAD